jgi:hypothetical protein
MLITNRVPELVAEKFGGKQYINLKQIERDTGLPYATIFNWVKKGVDRIDTPTLREVVCLPEIAVSATFSSMNLKQ